MLQGVISVAQKCQTMIAPNFLQGANRHAHKCHKAVAPTSFIRCRDIIAAMLIQKRTKGRVTPWPQQCHMRLALPNQFNGVIVKTQKCRDIVAPRGEPSNVRRDASIGPLSPTSYRGVRTLTQQCHPSFTPANHRGH